MRIPVLIRRAMLTVAGAVVLTAAGVAGVLAYPQPLFAYHVAAGRLALYSDVAFEPAAGRAVLAEVAGRLGRSGLDDRAPHRIFIANAEWRRRLLFLWGYGAGGSRLALMLRRVCRASMAEVLVRRLDTTCLFQTFDQSIEGTGLPAVAGAASCTRASPRSGEPNSTTTGR